MDRRNALKTLMLASGGMFALPSWAVGWSIDDVTDHNSSFTRLEQELITSIADTIIPSDGTIGALSVGVDKFLVRLIENCFEEDFRDSIKAHLQSLNRAAKNKTGVSFGECAQKQREDIFSTFSSSGNEEEKEFFDFMKNQAIRGFNTSEEVMVNYHDYVMMPGFYNGCVDVKS